MASTTNIVGQSPPRKEGKAKVLGRAQYVDDITLPGMWFGATLLFGWYLQHYADYSVIYGSLAVGIALLTWMYLISLVVLIGAEFNAMLYPRGLGKPVRRATDNNR